MLAVVVTFGGLLVLGYLAGLVRPVHRARYWAEGHLYGGGDTSRLRLLRRAALYLLLPDIMLPARRKRTRTPRRPLQHGAAVHRPGRRHDEPGEPGEGDACA